jgi:hypothetical protein
MKITPVGNTTPQSHAQTPAADARQRAIDMLMTNSSTPQEAASKLQSQAQTTPVLNPSKVAPEEMSAIIAPTKTSAQAVQDTLSDTEVEETPQTPEAPKVDPEIEKKFQEIARQERILRAKAQKQLQEIKAREDALNAQKAALEAREKQFDTSRYVDKQRLKADPLGVLAEAELSYDELTQQLLNQAPKDPRVDAQISRLEQTIKALEAKLEDTDKSYKQQQSEAYQQAIKQMRRDTEALVKQNAEEYEAIAKTDAIDDVVELIEATYKKDGIVLTVEEAAKEVEDYLIEESLKTVSRIEKIKKRLNPPSVSTTPAKVEEPKKQPQTEQPQVKTLTNAIASTRKMSARERAILAFKGEKPT